MQKNLFLIIFMALIMISCSKEKITIGTYIGHFQGSYTRDSLLYNSDRVYNLNIINSSNDEIVIKYNYSNSTLSRDKNRVSGILDISEVGGSDIGYYWGPAAISGNVMDEGDRNIISGDFSQTYKIISSVDSVQFETVIKGTFTIK
ncbi:MAG TPA: hypothetical protein VE912_01515 [Bacteroidales bacterium]|nr:hypothetical protein [Bacteroidales bacterium]